MILCDLSYNNIGDQMIVLLIILRGERFLSIYSNFLLKFKTNIKKVLTTTHTNYGQICCFKRCPDKLY